MKVYLLDTSALLTLRDDEPGADRVAELLKQVQDGVARCLGCFITLTEVLYRVWRDEGEDAGWLAYEQCLSLPIEWVHESPDLLKRAAAIKATYPLSLWRMPGLPPVRWSRAPFWFIRTRNFRP